MKILRVTSNGRITIPTKLRKKYKIESGTRVNFFEEKDGIKITPLTKATINAGVGFLGTKGEMLRSLMEEKKSKRKL